MTEHEQVEYRRTMERRRTMGMKTEQCSRCLKTVKWREMVEFTARKMGVATTERGVKLDFCMECVNDYSRLMERAGEDDAELGTLISNGGFPIVTIG